MADQFSGEYTIDGIPFETHKKEDYKVQVLLPSKSKEADKLEVQIIASEALEIIGRFLPEWKPQQRTVVAVWNTQAEGGAYVGKWDDSHHLLITVSEQEIINADKRAALVLRVAHELLHQRVAEIVGTDDANGIGIDQLLNHQMVKKMTDFEKTEIMFGRGGRASFLQKIINEGCAVYGELQITEAILGDITCDTNLVSAAIEMMHRRTVDLVASQADEGSTYSVGFRLVNNLVNIFKGQRLDTLLALVDWEECAEFQIGSEKYQEVIDNPQKIPGLEVLSAK